jgi:hypothetical protein
MSSATIAIAPVKTVLPVSQSIADAVEVEVEQITIDGIDYMVDAEGKLYDIDTAEYVKTIDRKTIAPSVATAQVDYAGLGKLFHARVIVSARLHVLEDIKTRIQDRIAGAYDEEAYEKAVQENSTIVKKISDLVETYASLKNSLKKTFDSVSRQEVVDAKSMENVDTFLHEKDERFQYITNETSYYTFASITVDDVEYFFQAHSNGDIVIVAE